jgi:hypothetical protein
MRTDALIRAHSSFQVLLELRKGSAVTRAKEDVRTFLRKTLDDNAPQPLAAASDNDISILKLHEWSRQP